MTRTSLVPPSHEETVTVCWLCLHVSIAAGSGGAMFTATAGLKLAELANGRSTALPQRRTVVAQAAGTRSIKLLALASKKMVRHPERREASECPTR